MDEAGEFLKAARLPFCFTSRLLKEARIQGFRNPEE